MGYRFSSTSKERLETCHEDLQKIMELALSLSDIDFGIAEGHRSVEDQQKYYNEGKSQIDGINKKSKHNYYPSRAVDIYAYFDGSASWDTKHLAYLGGLIQGISELLKREGEVSHTIRWGGNWDMDGIIVLDHSFVDMPHFEIIS